MITDAQITRESRHGVVPVENPFFPLRSRLVRRSTSRPSGEIYETRGAGGLSARDDRACRPAPAPRRAPAALPLPLDSKSVDDTRKTKRKSKQALSPIRIQAHNDRALDRLGAADWNLLVVVVTEETEVARVLTGAVHLSHNNAI